MAQLATWEGHILPAGQAQSLCFYMELFFRLAKYNWRVNIANEDTCVIQGRTSVWHSVGFFYLIVSFPPFYLPFPSLPTGELKKVFGKI